MSVRTRLEATRAIVATPDKWCKCSGHVKDANGERRCLLTALGKSGAYGDGEWYESRAALMAQIGGRRIHHWNDDPERTHADVLDVLNRAISAA